MLFTAGREKKKFKYISARVSLVLDVSWKEMFNFYIYQDKNNGRSYKYLAV